MVSYFGPIINKYDAFVCPTLSIPAVKADINLFKDKNLDQISLINKSISSET